MRQPPSLRMRLPDRLPSLSRWWVRGLLAVLAVALSSCGGEGNPQGATPASVAVAPVAAPVAGIELLAGGLGGAGTLDATGTSARFNLPAKTAVGPDGSVYVADYQSHTIRKIAPDGAVTTLAGKPGESGSSEGSGSDARFNGPVGIFVAADNTLYVADNGNNTIRVISPAGVVSTLAGQAGSSGSKDDNGAAARFNGPAGIVATADGTVYVLDSLNHTLRKITAAGDVSTVAGTAGQYGTANGFGSAARFNTPNGLATDGAGNLYIADSGNNTIRKFIIATGEVSTVAGLGQAAGSNNGTGSAARFYQPYDVTATATGVLYVADTYNSMIREITADGVVSTVAGSSTESGAADGNGTAARFAGPTGIAVSGDGTLYVADTYNNIIRAITPAGDVSHFAGREARPGAVDDNGAVARFKQPGGVAVGPDGTVYVTDTFNHTVRQVTTAGAVTTLAGLAGTSGTTDDTGAAARFNTPIGIVADSNGNLFITDSGNNTIRKVTPAGVTSPLAGSAGIAGTQDGTGTSARFSSPFGIGIDAAGNLYVADAYNHTIRKVTPAGVTTTLAGKAGFYGSSNGTGSAARFYIPFGIAVGHDGTVYVSDQGNHVIRKVTQAGVVTTLAGSAGVAGSADGPAADARFDMPTGIVVDADDNVYVVDVGNGLLRKITPAGDVSTVAGVPGSIGVLPGPLPGSLASPVGLALGTAGELYASDENSILKITLSPAPATNAVNFQASTLTLPLGDSLQLDWKAPQASDCSASGDWSGSKGTAGSATLTPSALGTYTYTLDCLFSTAPARSRTLTVTVVPPLPTLTLSASATLVEPGTPITLTWSSTNTTTCTASSAWTGSQPTSGSAVVTPAEGTRTYILDCTGPGGSTSSSVTVRAAYVPTLTFTATPAALKAGDPITLTWSTANATTCTASGSWSGSRGSSGTQTLVPAYAGNFTFTLTCTGVGGTVTSSQSVTATERSNSAGGGGGGGGASGFELLLGLGLLAWHRRRRDAAR